MSKVKILLDVVEDLRSLADSVQAVADAMQQNEPTVDAEPKTPAPAPQKELTLEEVRAVLGEKSRAGFTTEIQALLRKYLQTTEGNVVHYGYIEKFIENLGERFNIREIAFDRWGAVQMVQNLESMGFTLVPFGQGFKDKCGKGTSLR